MGCQLGVLVYGGAARLPGPHLSGPHMQASNADGIEHADRCSDLAMLDLKFWTYKVEWVRFIIPSLTKLRRTGPTIEAFYPSFPGSPKLRGNFEP